MRFKIEFELFEPKDLTINYNYYIASWIYRCVERADPDLSLELHKPRTMKLFTFSRLQIPESRFQILDGRMKVESDFAYLFFSTPKKEIAEAFVSGALERPEGRIERLPFVIRSIQVMREPEIKSEAKFITMSPISVTTFRDGRILDLYPKDPKFYENIRKNLIKKYVTLYKREPENDELEIEVIEAKAKKITIKNTHHRCVDMVFLARGSPELLKLGYQAGFGERNSMGFGMVKVV